LKTTLKKIGEWVTLAVGAAIGIAFAGFLAGGVTIFLFRSLVPSVWIEDITPPANNIADWRSLVVIAIGCLAIVCFLAIKSLLSRPLGKLTEKSFERWDAVVAHRSGVEWLAQFILPKPSPEEIRAASAWKKRSDDFDKRIWTKQYLVSYEADEHEIIKHKKSLPSYPRLKRAAKIRLYFIGIPICLFLGWSFLAFQSQQDAEDEESADNQEAVDGTAAIPWFENPAVRHWWLNVTLVCSAVGFSLWVISSRSENRYIKILGADATYKEDDDEIYVADPTSFESWRQAFVDRHGHDMSVEQEKQLRAKVDKVIDAYEQERAALRKLSGKIDEIQK
jgi:hypothetical protein